MTSQRCPGYKHDNSGINIDTNKFKDVPGVKSSGDKFVMIYTCKICDTRSAKTISQHAYHNGTVLVKCPGCQNLHLIADHLGTFGDEFTIQQYLEDQGENVKVVNTQEDVLELTNTDILGKEIVEETEKR